MPAPIAFYFDIISPYGYIGAFGIEQVAARLGREVDWRPMLLGITMFKVMGLKAVPDTPLKGAYAAHDWPRFARLVGLPAVPGASTQFAPLPAMRAFIWLKDRDAALARRFGLAVYRAHWGEGRDMSTPEAVAGVAASLGIDRAGLLSAIASEAVKDRLKAEVDASIGAGVFGCPTFVVDGEMFWGADRLDQVERWAKGGW